MEAVVKYAKGHGNVGLRDMPEPIPQDNQVVLEVSCCGICGTDLHVYHDTFKNYPPVILGHEFAGKVVELGKAVQGIAIDDTFSVLGAVAVTCGSCYYCQQGEFMFCANRRGMGHGVHGAFTRYAVARPDQLYAVPAGVSLEAAALVEPFAAAVHAVCDIARFKLGDIALVSGPGPIGLLVVKLLAAQGIQTLVVGTQEDALRLEKAKAYGAARVLALGEENFSEVIEEVTQGRGVDIAFEVAGAEGSVRNCMDALRPLGHYVQVGHFGQDLRVPWDHIAFRQLQISGSVGYTRATWSQTMNILEQGQVKIEDTITHRLPLQDWKKGFDLMEQKQAIKILLQA
ncbi:MAG: alcohol dehydrogenase catalytic domain-containing protein [Saprospiraceae bacterium]|nr:alcohol dehydrogenase catalytic domain-containing protein [Saprospiraceae bacterium]